MAKKLTAKQQAFVDYYIQYTNGSKAAELAGYSKKTARQIAVNLLSRTDVKEAIQSRMAEKDKERIASQDEILMYLTQIMRGETTEEVLRGVGEGAQTIDDMEVSAKDRIKAAELLGKRYMLWTEKHNIEGTVGVVIVDDTGEDDEDEDE